VPVIRAFNPDIQIVLHMHCEWLTQLHAPTIEKRLEQVDLILGCSPYITKTIQQKFPQFSDRSQTVVNGVDVDAFANTAISAPTDGLDLQADKSDRTMSQSQKQQRLLFVGRVSPEKGVHVLLDAFRDVVARFPQAQLTIVGPNRNSCRKEKLIQLSDDPRVQALERFYPGPYMKHLRSHLPEGLEQQIRFTGAVPHQQLPDYYRQADILINPSLSEASGVSLLEAMAMGLPVIGARIGGMPDNIEAGKTGLLVEPDNASALAQAIAQLLADNELRASMGRAGRQRAIAHFAWERVTEGLLGHYTHIITGHEPVSSDPADAAVVPQIATAESQTL
jgi:glycosyltransferase involved in cell wall biosynthesis